MEIRSINSLTPWDKNYRSLSKNGYERLKKQILTLGQHSTFLITKDNQVIGGNMRLKVMKDLGITDAKCIVLDWIQEDEGYIAVIDGEPVRSTFYKTVDDLLMAYNLSHNDRAGFYNDDFINHMSEFKLDFKEFAVDFEEPKSLSELTPLMDTPEEKKEQFKLLITCKSYEHQRDLATKLEGEGETVKKIVK